MILKVLIADDDESIGAYLKKIIEEVPDVSVVEVVNNGKEAVKQVEILSPHAVFLDIDMPEMTGVEAARELVELDPVLNFVFVTAYPDYALEAFELYSFDYILKPLDEKRVKKTIRKLKEKISMEQANRLPKNENLLVKVDGRQIFVHFNEILFIESQKHKLLVKTKQEEYLIAGSLHALKQHLNQDFFQCHKGYLVNLKNIKKIIPSGRTFEVFFKTGDKILLSREREKELREKLNIKRNF